MASGLRSRSVGGDPDDEEAAVTTSAQPSILQHSVEQARHWIDETAAELGHDDNRAAYRALKGVLHALRDRTTVAESAQLASQLPELIRGAFYENWRPAGTPERYRTAAAFLDRVRDGAGLAGETEASFAVSAVMTVLRRHVSAGELEDVLATMPAPVRDLLET
jgi:uncharacterized protein (DUF2267 family)